MEVLLYLTLGAVGVWLVGSLVRSLFMVAIDTTVEKKSGK